MISVSKCEIDTVQNIYDFEDIVDRMYEIQNKVFEIVCRIRHNINNNSLPLLDQKKSLLDDYDNLNLFLYEHLIEESKKQNIRSLIFLGSDGKQVLLSLD